MNITIYTKNQCIWCARAKAELRDRGLDFTELHLDQDYTLEDLQALIGPDKPRTMPQTVIDGKLIGTHDQLVAWLKERYDAQDTNQADF